MRHSAWPSLVLVALVGGCGTSTPGSSDRDASQASVSPQVSTDIELPTGTEVTMLGQKRGFTEVQLPDGSRGFVRPIQLMRLESSDQGKYLVVAPGSIHPVLPSLDQQPTVPPRPRNEIIADQMILPIGFISNDSGTFVLASANQMIPFRDEASGAWMWPAYACYVPDCPGRKADGEPFIFPQQDRLITIRSNRAEYVVPPADKDTPREVAETRTLTGTMCPACLKNRDLESETPLESERYQKLVRRYIPPESAARRIQLEEEYRRLLREKRKRGQN